MKTRLWLSFAMLPLLACGEPVEIADEVHFRVSFQSQTVSVRFNLNTEYQVPTNALVPYANEESSLGEISLLWDPETKQNQLQSTVFSHPKSLSRNWPAIEIFEFPNGEDFSEPMTERSIQRWTKRNHEMGVSLLFPSRDILDIGGVVQSREFDFINKDFLATQVFKDSRGDVRASISILGPTEDELGGLWFTGHLGINPFIESSRHFYSQRDSIEWSLEAEGPAKVINAGTGSRRWWHRFSPARFRQQLDQFLESH